MNKLDIQKVKLYIAIIAFAASLVIGFIAMFTPPPGEIHQSILWFVAQLLVFTSTLLGISMKTDMLNNVIEGKPANKKDENDD